MNDQEREEWNKLASVRAELMRNGFKPDDPSVVELRKRQDDIETGKSRSTVKILKAEHKDYWYKNLVGEVMEVRDSCKEDFKLVDFISNKAKNNRIDSGCGYILKTDCVIV